MTRQALFLKWTEYTLAFLLVFIVETVVLRRLPVFGAVPVLAPLCVVAVAVFESPLAGTVFGLMVGILCQAAYYRVFGSAVILCTAVGFFSGLVTQYALNRSLAGSLICSAGALVLLDGVRGAFFLGRGEGLLPILRVAAPEFFYSMLFVAPIYLLFRQVYRRVGGNRLE